MRKFAEIFFFLIERYEDCGHTSDRKVNMDIINKKTHEKSKICFTVEIFLKNEFCESI